MLGGALRPTGQQDVGPRPPSCPQDAEQCTSVVFVATAPADEQPVYLEALERCCTIFKKKSHLDLEITGRMSKGRGERAVPSPLPAFCARRQQLAETVPELL